MNHSLPLAQKTDERIQSGYDSEHFGDNYWLTPDAAGRRRIDRKATSIVNLLKHLTRIGVVPENPKVLDIGAGPGNMVSDFIAAGFDCQGCEFSESGRRLAKKHFGLELDYCDLRASIPYQNSAFDFAYCVGVMTMVPLLYVEHSFREMKRILKPTGILHINLLNPKPVQNEPHLTSMPMAEWLGKLNNAGLEDCSVLWPPQREGIGMNNEFSGLFRARQDEDWHESQSVSTSLKEETARE